MKTAKPGSLAAVPRLPIPVLRSYNMKIGAEGQLRRSWPVAPGEFFRIYLDEPLSLELAFSKAPASPRVVLHTNLLSVEGQWDEIEFERKHQRWFSISIKPTRCGIFLFKLKYSTDNGVTWFWDRTPFTKVIVDPAFARDIRQYTLIPTASGHMGQWKTELSRIRDMGFNMVHLLPVTQLDASQSPYASADLFAIDPSYLDPKNPRKGLDQFESFVLDAREKGIALCLDLVLNHIGITSVMAVRTPEWIVPDKNETDGLLRAGCWHMNNWIKWEDLVRINYDHPEPKTQQEIWRYMTDYALFWGNYAAFTNGMVRLDNLHASHPGFITSMLNELHTAFPSLVAQAEYFSDSNTLLRTASESRLALYLANPWEYPFAASLRDYLKYIHGISAKIRFLTPVSTHDTGSAAQLYGSPDAVVPRYFVTALMTTGQTGMVQGGEHGLSEKIKFIGRNQRPGRDFPDRYTDAIRKINGLHRAFPLFHQGGNLTFVDNNHGALLFAFREDKASSDERFLLCANLDTSNVHGLSIPCAAWKRQDKRLMLHEMLLDAWAEVEGDELWIELAPCGVKAFKFEYQ